MGKTEIRKDLDNNQLILERTFDAPKTRVWQAWTDPEIFAQWWGPNGWETTIKEFDFREGGANVYCMKCVDEAQKDFYGMESCGKMVFGEIQPEDYFTYKDYFTDTDGKENVEMPTGDSKLSLEEVDSKTKLTSVTTYATKEELETVISMGVEQGISETFDKLAEKVES